MKKTADTLQSTQVKLSSDTIELGIGQPDPDLLPHDDIKQAATHCINNNYSTSMLPYGHEEGCDHFRQELSQFLSRHYRQPVSLDRLFITNGNSQGLSLICTLFCHSGDTIFVEEPTYNLALKIFADHHLNVVSIPMDDNGIIIEELEEKAARFKPNFLYTIPSFHNPTGITLSQKRREQIIALSQAYNFLVVADEVYQLLHFGTPPPPPMADYLDSDTVLSLGTFSKILAPGLRLGWIQTGQYLMSKLVDAGVVHSGGGLNPFTSGFVRSILELDLLDPYLDKLKGIYGRRCRVICQTMSKNLPSTITFKEPEGGFFVWLKFPSDIDTKAILTKARQDKTGFKPGFLFSCNRNTTNYARLCFAYYGENQLETGIKRLAGSLLKP